MNRRHFLGTAVAACALAGCTGSETPEHSEATDAWGRFTTTTGSDGETAFKATVPLASGEYAKRSATPQTGPAAFTIDFTVQEDRPIDLLFLTEGEYNTRYRDGDAEEVSFINDLSAPGSTGTTLSGSVQAGKYYIVLDNTGAYGTEPDGDVTVEITIS